MSVTIRPYTSADAAAAAAVWNEVVRAGRAFPQQEELTPAAADVFFRSQSATRLAGSQGAVAGLYILHPNNVGRCGHIANASFAVAAACRGQGLGEALVRDCLRCAGALGFRILQFNAVVASNTAALALYRKLGFTPLGVIPGGFLNRDGVYEDIIPHYIALPSAGGGSI